MRFLRPSHMLTAALLLSERAAEQDDPTTRHPVPTLVDPTRTASTRTSASARATPDARPSSLDAPTLDLRMMPDSPRPPRTVIPPQLYRKRTTPLRPPGR